MDYGGSYDNFQMRLYEENKNETRNNTIKKMVKIVSVCSIVIIILTSFIQEALFASEDDRKIVVKDDEVIKEIIFSHHAILDKDGKYHLLWLPEENTITFEVQVISAIFPYFLSQIHFCHFGINTYQFLMLR